MSIVISNPPYNMKWQHPFFAQSQSRFDLGLPPENNANFAFVLSALDHSEKATFILPNAVLYTSNKDEFIVKKNLVDKNYLEAVISLPGNMFESTSIPTCILVFNKRKSHSYTQVIDLKGKETKEIRDQRGQYGKTNTNRVYKKELNVLSNDVIKEVLSVIESRKNEVGFTKSVSINDIKEQEYDLNPGKYIDTESVDNIHRPYEDIIKDLNRIIESKNGVKITINEKMAKDLEIYDLMQDFKQSKELNKNMNEMLKAVNPNLKIKKEDIAALSRNKEMKFEVKNFERVPEMIALFISMWKQFVMTLNNEENRLLVELRDALLPDLISGDIDVSQNEYDAKEDK
ncbi:SAM-dependent methyltransferase [Tetragenococcus koreensis]|uniref:N-6 DNA methylase n=1 Tax=Tetragenococcus koreensis TaxID=290335 RepID=UPI001F41B621|nr:N-6 DNA methylase [Tetragenococcus koreensis]MCF1614799.1 SAM-dependent methyltransferase [Tetragenococcus koreensis]MDN6345418.1 SAM-dependent methyltransferase [Tetragenococcus koreensis]